MKPVILPGLGAMLIAVLTLFASSLVNATEPTVDKRFDQLIDGCLKFGNADPKSIGTDPKNKDGAEACEKVANVIKIRTDLHQKSTEMDRTLKERERWASFGWPGLVLFDLFLVGLVIALLYITKGNSSELLKDPDGKISFSRVIGLFGATSIFIASALLLNVLLAHLYVFNTVPDGIVSLFAPILTFIPTLLPYVFAKREEGSIARGRALADTSH